MQRSSREHDLLLREPLPDPGIWASSACEGFTEYSFVETLRHLLFAGDAWLQGMVLGVPLSRARVIDCFRIVFREEWWHHQFATRDLAVVEGG